MSAQVRRSHPTAQRCGCISAGPPLLRAVLNWTAWPCCAWF